MDSVTFDLDQRMDVQETWWRDLKACLRHRFIRSRDTSNIVERPERLRAVNVGLAAAIARLERCDTQRRKEEISTVAHDNDVKTEPDSDDLTTALGRLDLTSSTPVPSHIPLNLVHSTASIDILNNAAVKYIHGDIQGDVYLENLKSWAKQSHDKITKGESEIPEGYSQGDLYLCPESVDAIQGALGTVCEAVDAIVGSSPTDKEHSNGRRAFVAIRPPGHHCGEDTPSGFCFVNNVSVGAAHAHLKHGINRVVILDIDLHHGNGTQAIAWQINEETYRKNLEQQGGAPLGKSELQIYYGSVHDILSFPCEDGKTELVQAASVSIHGPHGQYIENIHLKPYSSEKEFWDELYAGPYAKLLGSAGEFLQETGGPGDDVLVPTSFYHRFARDACAFAERFARGRLISVLEGGYSDRALTSGVMAHITGLVHSDEFKVDEQWWSQDNLVTLEKATKKRRGGRPSQTTPLEPWLERTLEIFASLDAAHSIPASASRAPAPPSSRTLRERKPANGSNENGNPSLVSSPKRGGVKSERGASTKAQASASINASKSSDSELTDLSLDSNDAEAHVEPKKLPRVILRLGPVPGSS
ncbi:Histone deacetylase HOS3 [Grifola frondosa]|uniref:Histone deacetylase HOS3 n=1 Tax=Grifola frondosa TaxID=5627 RepID=A0A1C7M0Z0_GRIFR|nr:Histone deacetylase HOS3 [Grifola frondosa]